jgi:hypothetical protein
MSFGVGSVGSSSSAIGISSPTVSFFPQVFQNMVFLGASNVKDNCATQEKPTNSIQGGANAQGGNAGGGGGNSTGILGTIRNFFKPGGATTSAPNNNVNWQTGDGYPRPPGWTEEWHWLYPAKENPNIRPRWFDPQGGEWRWHATDRHHDTGHWDHNPWNAWNDKWTNVYR